MATVKTLLGHVKGDTGEGVPSGGTTGQILQKKSATDYDTEWVDDSTAAVWGNITGTLSNQSDLNTALGSKANSTDLTTHTGNTSNPHSVTKSQVDLGNVPNTDFTTPVANATAHIASTSNPHSVTKAQVGLGDVDNTSDVNKPISTATQTALDNKVSVVTGKGLSTNDYDNSEKANVASNTSARHTHSNKSELDLIASGDKAKWDAKTTVAVSATGTATDEVQYITVDGVEKKLAGGGSTAWGDITGTLSQQTDLQTALDAKLAKAVPTSEQGNKEYLYTFAGTTQKTNIALINDMSSSVSGYTDSMVPTALSVATVLANKEATSNKVTSVSSSSTDTQYPTAKCLYDMVGNIESLLEAML